MQERAKGQSDKGLGLCYQSELYLRNFPGGPMVKTLHFCCREHRFDPWLRN